MTLGRYIMVSMILVVGLSGLFCTVIGGYLLWGNLMREAENRVRQDLNAAHEFYRQQVTAVRSALQYTAIGERFRQAVAQKEIGYLAPRLTALRGTASLDMLCITDAQGVVLHRADRPGVLGDSLADSRLVRQAMDGRQPVAGTVLMSTDDLEKEDPAMAQRARIPLIATPRAKPTDMTELATGMVVAAAVPVFDQDGATIGVLRGGILLNRDNRLVDQVRDTVFRKERYAGKPLGTATVFVADVRVSTNVLREDGARAVGTRVSQEVNDQVLGRGEDWLGPSWVVNDWYVAAYSPIHDVDGARIGMLYVGVLRIKYRDAAIRTLATFGLITSGGLAVASLLAWRLSKRISRPVGALVRASKAISRGDFAETVPIRPESPRGVTDEIDALSRVFNSMAASLMERDRLLKEQTQLHLTRSERLASVGRLAAGIAHEINNPLTGVLTFAHMLLRSAPDGSREKEDAETIIEATTRCRDIIRGLLDFSRQNEPHKRPSDLNDVLAAAMHLTRNQALLHHVEIVREMAEDLPPVHIDPGQIQDVAVNVIINAIDAMPDGGTLTLRTRPAGAQDDGGMQYVEFEIADTGCGIPPENLDRVFDPFFTTKPTGKGTGLGLAISYGIVTEHGGNISISSESGRGTSVKVLLPAADKEAPREQDRPSPGAG